MVKTSNTIDTNTYTWSTSSTEKGWECPRCHRINAPWVRQCDCSPNKYEVTWTPNNYDTTNPDWYKQVMCGDSCPDNVLNNPVTYKVESIDTIGGSDYYNPKTHTWDNTCKNQTNTMRG